ncbi:autotransporter domain-containing protein [Comamonas jiangduensis]|uniref:autotransporter domain-containing protein n=1 Tax=Comamonas jiangduensis TaxID=1194168 RepID=UPI003BF8BEDE
MCVFAAAVFVLLLNVFWVPTAAHAAGGLTLTTSQTNVSCNGGTNGTATVTASGGIPPYTYSWAPSGGSNATATGLAAGSYSATVTDAGGAVTTATVTVSQPSVLSTTSSQIEVSSYGGSDGSAGVVVTGGTPGYTYSWAPSGGTDATANGLSAGNYTVTVTDANACTYSRIFTITQPALAVPTASPVSATVPYGSVGNPMPLLLGGGAATSVAMASGPAHGTVFVSGTSITYSPNPGYAGPDSFTYTATNSSGTSVPAMVSITVEAPVKAPQTITFAPPGAQNFGTTPTLSASSTSNLTVSLTSSTTGVCTITSGGTLTFVSAGTCTINADQAGNAAYLAATQVSQSFTVNPVIPGAPTIGTATVGDGQASVSFTPPASNGGSSITGYTVTSNPGGFTEPGTASPIIVTGLANGTAYTFTVTATNSAGTGAASGASNSVTPVSSVPPTITLSPATIANPTVGVPYSQSIAAAGGAAPYTYAISGSLPTGLTFASNGILSGTPTVAGSYNFTVIATDSSTGAGAPFAGSRAYSVTVAAPTLVLSPASGSLPSATVGGAYSQGFTASGGTAPYTYAITSGSVPTGLSLAANGTLSGTPTVAGSYNFTVTTTDSSTGAGAPFTSSHAYSVTVAAGAIPVVSAIAPSSGPSSGGTTVTITGTGFGGATAVTFGASSATGFTVNSATQITATAPAGTGTVDIRVTTAGGTSATSAADQFTYVVAPAIPSLSISDVTQNEGNSGGAAFNFTVTLTSASASAVTVNYATSNGSATAPSDYTATSGALTFAPGQITQTVTVQVNGDTTVEPDETFFVNLSSPFNATLGKSQGVATIVNDDNALSVSAPNKTVSVAAGAEAVVDVVAGATGGPFTAATVVSLAPASAGVATIAGGTGAYSVRFVPAASFAGVAVVTYTLTNGAVQSAPATVTITVAARVDAAQDAEVAGLATAQASAAQRFTTAQVTNFTQRLESLHGSGWGRSSFGLSLATDDTRKMARNGNGVADQVINGNPLRNGMRTVGLKPQRVAQAQPSPVNDLPDLPGTTTEQARSPWAFWVNGAISYGRERTGDADERYRFTTNGISAGVDYRVNGWITVGTGLGISTDRSRVGNKGTRSNADSTVAVAYASMRPMQGVFVDALLGYGVLSFDSKRYITATGDMATGSRDGKQLFGSIATGLEFYRADWMWSPYARLEFSQAKLDAYTENGPATHALKYFDQTARSSKAVLGARAEGKMAVRWGHIMPQVRVEYARSFDEQNEAGLAYADLADQGPAYTLRGRAMDIGRWTVGLGGRLLLRSGTELGVEYTTNIDQSNAYVGSLRLGLRVPF